ncbi:hypothetical protein M513_08435 [Trichuris suis]|uniref:DDE-1 domain-containing protein n=1 Tax=Trichuris suis TaxID=68888 RepID=A0A085M082_9BILA|nr:hypothetical protein M513_08435 [Trichuris suis]
MEEGGYDEEFVYNADKAGLNWKSLPTRSLVAHHEAHTSGHKARKERVTVMICANSMGSHRLPLFVIGKPANPRSFRNVKKLPVVYSHQKKAWMNVHVFNEWFERTFIPEVKRSPSQTKAELHYDEPYFQVKRYQSSIDTGDWNADLGVNREVEEIMDTLQSTCICEECERADVERWLASDEEDRGLQTMDDEEILEFISKEPAETEEEPQYGDDQKEERPAAPSDSEAFQFAEVLMKWYEGQEESVPQRLLCLKSIRDLAASKRRSVYRQAFLTDLIKSG